MATGFCGKVRRRIELPMNISSAQFLPVWKLTTSVAFVVVSILNIWNQLRMQKTRAVGCPDALKRRIVHEGILMTLTIRNIHVGGVSA
jgi:hypothetical protein